MDAFTASYWKRLQIKSSCNCSVSAFRKRVRLLIALSLMFTSRKRHVCRIFRCWPICNRGSCGLAPDIISAKTLSNSLFAGEGRFLPWIPVIHLLTTLVRVPAQRQPSIHLSPFCDSFLGLSGEFFTLCITDWYYKQYCIASGEDKDVGTCQTVF